MTMAEYIDRDKLKYQLKLESCVRRIKTLEDVEEIIDFLPAADVAPVKHGKWIKKTVSSGRESWECSLCHRRARGKEKNLPYCHCGAKMDLEG